MQRLKLTRDEGRLLVVHTGRQVNGQNRYGVAIINTRTNKLTPFKTTLWEDNLQFVGGIQRIYGGDISPDGSKFVVSSGSGGDRPPINDTVIVFNLNNDSDAQPRLDLPALRLRVLGHLDRGGHLHRRPLPVGRGHQRAGPVAGPRRRRVRHRTGTLGVRPGRRRGEALPPRRARPHGRARAGVVRRRRTPTRATSTSRPRRAACSSAATATPRAASTSAGSRSSTSTSVPANNSTQTVITDPIEGRIKPVDEAFEITGTATAPSGVNRVELEIMDRNSGRYLADDLHHVGQHDASTRSTRRWTRAPGRTAPGAAGDDHRQPRAAGPGPRGREQRHRRQHQGGQEVRDVRHLRPAARHQHHRPRQPGELAARSRSPAPRPTTWASTA